jgi:hypothetical protein
MDVDDLAVLVDRPVDVSPPSGDLHIVLIDVPTVADRVSARLGRNTTGWAFRPVSASRSARLIGV